MGIEYLNQIKCTITEILPENITDKYALH